MRRYGLAAAIAILLLGGTAIAQETRRTEARENANDPSKFFVFHLEGVSYQQARSDYLYCVGQAEPIRSQRDQMGYAQGGLLGSLINGRMGDIDRFRMRNAAMRQCMGLIGYHRYALPEPEWNAMVANGNLVVGNDQQVDMAVVERLARYASGEAPATQRLDP
jgi:hypothetical protein